MICGPCALDSGCGTKEFERQRAAGTCWGARATGCVDVRAAHAQAMHTVASPMDFETVEPIDTRRLDGPDDKEGGGVAKAAKIEPSLVAVARSVGSNLLRLDGGLSRGAGVGGRSPSSAPLTLMLVECAMSSLPRKPRFRCHAHCCFAARRAWVRLRSPF